MAKVQPAKCDSCPNTSYTLNVIYDSNGDAIELLCDECFNREKSEEDRS